MVWRRIMKVCILSMQMVDNYGSVLQAYSLKKIIENMGHSVDFISIRSLEEEKKLAKDYVKEYKNENDEYENIIAKLVAQDDRSLISACIKVGKRKIMHKMFDAFRKKYQLNNNDDKNYDICVIGSDEVFNCLQNTPWGFSSQLFGNVAQAKKVITYAACCGYVKYEDVSEQMKAVIRQSFERISAFSVRDENTYSFVKKINNVDSVINPDPVVVGDFEEEIRRSGISKKLPSKYCIVYGYNNRIKDDYIIKETVELCKKNNMEIISIGGSQKWVKKHMLLNPFEVLYAFKNAGYVLTDTFHGAIFSIRYADRFGIILRDSNKNKLQDLIERFKVENHLIKKENDVERIYNLDKNTDYISKKIELERKRTIEYLDGNLKYEDNI